MLDIVSQKRCPKCGERKDKIQFSKDKSKKDELSAWCKACMAGIQHAWYLANKDKSYAVVCKRRHDNPNIARDETRLWRANNPDRTRELAKKYRGKYPDAARERLHAWQVSNPEKVSANNRKRRARKKGSGGKITAGEWLSIKKRYNFTCLCCGKIEPEINLTLDHVIPLAMGGTNTIDNAQPLCLSCNCSKGNNHIDYRKN